MWRPMTTRHSVSGVDKISPIGPHSQDQKIAATITENGESPVEWPYSSGSIAWPVIPSATMKKAAVHSAIDQPGSIAAARTTGSSAEISEPT